MAPLGDFGLTEESRFMQLFFVAFALSPLAREGVSEIACAKECIKRLGQAAQIGVHSRRNLRSRFGADGSDQAHGDGPQDHRIHDIEEARPGAAGPRIGGIRLGDDGRQARLDFRQFLRSLQLQQFQRLQWLLHTVQQPRVVLRVMAVAVAVAVAPRPVCVLVAPSLPGMGVAFAAETAQTSHTSAIIQDVVTLQQPVRTIASTTLG